MQSRELVKAALTFHTTPRIPDEFHDVAGVSYLYGKGRASGAAINTQGIRYDEWGTQWVAAEDGVSGEVRQPLIDDWSKLEDYRPPYDVLEQADLRAVNGQCAASDKFIIPMWNGVSYNLFERMQWLRGTQELFMDLALGEPAVLRLRDMVHQYFMEQAALWADTDVDGLHIADDWGTQTSLLLSPAMWREVFRPCYKAYCDLAHAHGKFVVMHSDGYTLPILDDLIDIGVDAINTQIFCMDIDQLAARYHHRLTFWGEIDRQNILPFGSPEDCRQAVHRVADAFCAYGRTGLVGQAFWGKDIPEENLAAVYDAWYHY